MKKKQHVKMCEKQNKTLLVGYIFFSIEITAYLKQVGLNCKYLLESQMTDNPYL